MRREGRRTALRARALRRSSLPLCWAAEPPRRSPSPLTPTAQTPTAAALLLQLDSQERGNYRLKEDGLIMALQKAGGFGDDDPRAKAIRAYKREAAKGAAGDLAEVLKEVGGWVRGAPCLLSASPRSCVRRGQRARGRPCPVSGESCAGARDWGGDAAPPVLTPAYRGPLPAPETVHGHVRAQCRRRRRPAPQGG